jgi:hypothetical protein
MLDERSKRSGDGPPAAGPARNVRPVTRPSDRGLVEALIPAHSPLDSLLPELPDDDSVLVMDAGSTLAPGFVSEARRRL